MHTTTTRYKVKKLSVTIIIFTIFAISVVSYIGKNYFLNYKKDITLNISVNRLSDIEKCLNNRLKQFVSASKFISTDEEFMMLYTNNNHSKNLTNRFRYFMVSTPFLINFRFVDKNGNELIKFEKQDDVVYNVSDKFLIINYEDEYFEKSKEIKTPFFSPIKINKDAIKYNKLSPPTMELYYPVVDKFDNFVGTLISEYNMNRILTNMTTSDLFNMVVYDKKGNIIYDNLNKQGVVYDVETTVLDNFFNYKEMLTHDVYTDGSVLSKMLNIKYVIINELGIYVTHNSNFNTKVQKNIKNLYYFYFTIFLIIIFVMSILLRKYLYDAHQLDELKKRNIWLEIKNEKLENDSITDPLTGLGNNKFCEKELDKLYDNFERHQHDFSLLIFTIDSMQNLYNIYGSNVVDEVIKILIENVKVFIRKTDIFTRRDKGEFAIILPNTNDEFSIKFSKKIEDFVNNLEFNVGDDRTLKITISIGVSSVYKKTDYDDSQKLIKRVKLDMKKDNKELPDATT